MSSVQDSRENTQPFEMTITINECREVVKEAKSLITHLGTISVGLTNAFIAKIALFTSFVAVTIAILPYLIRFHSRPDYEETYFINILVSTALLIIFVTLAWFIATGLLSMLGVIKDSGSSRKVMKELLSNCRNIIEQCYANICCQVYNSSNMGDQLLCKDLKTLSNVLDMFLGEK